MSQQYFLCRNNKIHGPFSVARLRELRAEGKLRNEDLVSTSAEGNWQPLSSILSKSRTRRVNREGRSAVKNVLRQRMWVSLAAGLLLIAGFAGFQVLKKGADAVHAEGVGGQAVPSPNMLTTGPGVEAVPVATNPAIDQEAKSQLDESAAFGFPRNATVLCNDDRLRLSVSSNAEYLFVQAVLWQDDGPGPMDDGTKSGDWSRLTLDLDGDGAETANVDRSYSVNPWPELPGLRYQIALGDRASTGLKDDSEGKGSIQYVPGPTGKTIRIDSYLLPFRELGVAASEEIRLSYWANSPMPKFAFSAVGSRTVDAWSSFATPHSDHYVLKLIDSTLTYDMAKIPDGRLDKPIADSDESATDSISTGRVPPEIEAADWLNTNSPESLASLRGQTVLVEFWATWCGPCVAGIPHLNEMQKKYGARGLRILSLTAENRETVEAFQKRLQEPIEYTVGLGSKSSEKYGVHGIPAAFLIGADGTLLWEGHPSSPQCEEAIARSLGVSVPAGSAREARTIPAGQVTEVGQTLASASMKKPIHDALLKKIERSRKEIEQYKRGHLIVGRIQTPGSNDPETVRSQMIIEDGGYFADAIGDLKRPIGFRQVGYRPFNLVISADAVPDENGVIDVGTLVMEEIPQSEHRQAIGQIALEGGGSPELVTVTLSLSSGPVNTPHNGTEGSIRSRPLPESRIDASGQLIVDGLTEGDYWLTYSHPGFVEISQGYVKVEGQQDLKLKPVELERPRSISVEFVVAQDSAQGFDAAGVKYDRFPAGRRWKVGSDTAPYGWDLVFKQIRRNVTFDYSYGPCTLADLGEGTVADFLNPSVNAIEAIEKDPRFVELTSGHVYLLKQKAMNHDVLFRVEVGEPVVPRNPRVLAHLNFNSKSVMDLADNGAECDTINPQLDGTAYLSNGIYEGSGDPKRQRFVVRTPFLNFRSFTVAMKFKLQSRDQQQCNILNGGTGYRWFGLSRTNSGYLSVELNNSQIAELKKCPLPLNKWHEIVCAVDLDRQVIGVSVNSGAPQVVPVPAGFQLDVVANGSPVSEKNWTFTNYSNGRTLRGHVDELTIFDGVFDPEDLKSLRQTLEH